MAEELRTNVTHILHQAADEANVPDADASVWLAHTTTLSVVQAIAQLRARDLGHSHVSTEHFLLALLDEQTTAFFQLMGEFGLVDELRHRLIARLSKNRASDAAPLET